MADISQIKLPNNTTYDLKDSKKTGIYYVKGTQTAATGAWTGNIDVPALYTGLTIMYYLPYDGSGNATLNLTLSNGTTTGAKNCYITTGRLTTHYGAGRNIIMTFYKAGDISIKGTATTDDRWICDAFYDTNNSAYVVSNYYNMYVAGANKIFPYSIIMQNADGRWESLVTSSSIGTTKTVNTHGFRLGQISYNAGNATYNENNQVGNNVIYPHKSDLIDHRYSFNTANDATNGTTSKKPVYLVGSLNSSDGLFYLDTVKWWTQTLPSTADGKLYIYLGDAYDYYRMSFIMDHPVYWYRNGMIREFAQDAATVNGLTVQTAVPANSVFTDTKVTSSTNHYTPATASGQDKTASASGATAAWSIDVVKGVTLNTDGKGHVTGLSVTSGKIPANPNSDTKVRQTLSTTNKNYPLLMSYAESSNTTANIDNVTYRANAIYANPSTGNLQATQLNGVTIGSAPKFTDANVTASDNHYTPATVSGQDKTASATGATAAWSIDVVKGVTLNTDGKGHVTGLSVTSGKIPANPNTDTKVRQTLSTTNKNYPLLMSYAESSNTTGNIDNVSYRANTIYANPSTGNIQATTLNGNSIGVWTSASTAAVGDTSITISNSNITANSVIDVYTSNSSGTYISLNTLVASAGSATITFDALAESTQFKLFIR